MDKKRNLVGTVFGVILILAGVLAFFGGNFDFIDWDNAWPLIVIGFGLVFFVVMVVGGKAQGGLAIPGSILVTIGLILLFMNNNDRWEAWAYSWTLIICAVGIGELIHGFWSEQPDLRQKGLKTLGSGVTLFLVFGTLLELIFSISGTGRFGNTLLWAALLILLGVYLLATRLLRLGKDRSQNIDLFWPVLMIGFGLAAVLADVGWVPRTNLVLLLNLWPLLLIAAGIGLLLHNRSPWVGASLGVFVVAAILVVSFAGEGLGLRSLPFWSFDGDLFESGDFSGERIDGSGTVITENRPVGSFDRVELGIKAELEIQSGPAESLAVSAEDNLLPLLVTNVSGGKLTIRFRPGVNVRPTKPVKIQLTVKNLKGLQNSSSGPVTVKSITTGDLRLEISSSGNITFEAIQADQITAEINSDGDILMRGNAKQLDLRVNSSGSFLGGDLQTQKARVRVSSSGEVTVWAEQELSVNISSSGNVAYYGSPEIDSNLTSSGRLIPKGAK